MQSSQPALPRVSPISNLCWSKLNFSTGLEWLSVCLCELHYSALLLFVGLFKLDVHLAWPWDRSLWCSCWSRDKPRWRQRQCLRWSLQHSFLLIPLLLTGAPWPYLRSVSMFHHHRTGLDFASFVFFIDSLIVGGWIFLLMPGPVASVSISWLRIDDPW